MSTDDVGSVVSSKPPFLKSNPGLLYLAVIAGIGLVILSVLIGLDPPFVIVLELLFIGAVILVQRLRSKRNPAAGTGAKGITATGVLAAALVFVAIQAIPYGRSHSNGAITAEPKWPDAQTRELAARACFSCHSNEVKYPWYSNVAPVSWLVQHHVDEGRDAINFSAIKPGRRYHEVTEVIAEGDMPPSYFTRFGLHSDAKLSKAEVAALIAGLKKIPEFQGRG